VTRISQMEPWIGEEERRAVDAYLASGAWLTEFQQTREFERMLAEYVGTRHAIVVTNGTVSLMLALKALGVGPGDEVLVPDFTMLASATAVQLAGAVPVFVDVERISLCMDLDLAEEQIGPRTRALMLVSLNGRSPDMARAVELCSRRGIALVEDAAQSLGSRWRGRHLGSFGALGSFSFSAPKIITTGQGGALTTDDDLLAERVRKWKDFGRRRAGEDFYELPGYNFKVTDLQSVIGIEQMKKLGWRVQRKKEIFARYRDLLADVSEVVFLKTELDDVAPWFIDVLVPDPEALRRVLAAAEIGSRFFYPALHSQPAFGLSGRFPNAEYAAQHGLWLPSSSFLTDTDVERVCEAARAHFVAA